MSLRLPKLPKAYRDVLVESFIPESTAGRHGPAHIRPLPGQVYATSLYVTCSTRMVDTVRYPVGTNFILWATLTSRLGGGRFLYARPKAAVVTVTDRQAKEFLAGLKKGRV